MQPVEIRPIEDKDFAIWLPLWKAYQRFYGVDFPESITLETWARFLDPIEPMHAALATVGEHAFGLAHTIYHRSTWTASDYCYLRDLFVAPDARGGGIGRALIEHVYADARRRGVSACTGSHTRPTMSACGSTTPSVIDQVSSIPAITGLMGMRPISIRRNNASQIASRRT